MPNRLLLHLASHQALRDFVTSTPLARPLVERFVAGDTLEYAIKASKALNAAGIGAILDHLGENVSTEEEADAAANDYREALRAIAFLELDAHVSVKLTQLGLDQSTEGAVRRLDAVAALAASTAKGPAIRVAIDMEAHPYTDRTIGAYTALRPAYDHLVLCLQAYLRRTEADVQELLPLRPSVRLCKGAYDEPADISYSRFATMGSYRRLLAMLLPAAPFTAVATHDDLCVKEALRIAHVRRIPADRFEFQMLYGVRRELQAQLAEQGFAVRVYVPYGKAWYPYLMRRLAERPANLRLFVEALARG